MLAVVGYTCVGPERLGEVGIMVDVVEGRPVIVVAPPSHSNERGGGMWGAHLLCPSQPTIVTTHPTRHSEVE